DDGDRRCSLAIDAFERASRSDRHAHDLEVIAADEVQSDVWYRGLKSRPGTSLHGQEIARMSAQQHGGERNAVDRRKRAERGDQSIVELRALIRLWIGRFRKPDSQRQQA